MSIVQRAAPADRSFESRFLSGAELFGNDFTAAQIAEWFATEEEGYAQLGAAEHGAVESYGYHALNERHAWRHLRGARWERALGLGSAYGGEFLPISRQIGELVIVEPSKELRSPSIGALVPRYVDPAPSGDLAFGNAVFDLAVCLGVLHHIPNVEHVVRELGRVVKPDAVLVVREPIVSMGDWRQPRPGLTRNERGIPRQLLRDYLAAAGFRPEHTAWCAFPTTRHLGHRSRALGYNGSLGVTLDAVLSRAFAWNYRYHPGSRWQKLRPTSEFLVLRKVGG